jgi:hypothetical protein
MLCVGPKEGLDRESLTVQQSRCSPLQRECDPPSQVLALNRFSMGSPLRYHWTASRVDAGEECLHLHDAHTGASPLICRDQADSEHDWIVRLDRSTWRVSTFFSLVCDSADATANVKWCNNCVLLARTNLHNFGIRITLSFQSAP